MFPQFFTRRLLLPGESTDQFREVTAKEREALEAKAATYVRPPQWMIDRFNYLANRLVPGYGGFDEDRGYFRLGTVHDLTEQDAVAILLSYSSIDGTQVGDSTPLEAYREIRAVFPRALSSGGLGVSRMSQRYMGCQKLEEVYFIIYGELVTQMFRTFHECRALRKIYFQYTSNVSNISEAFANCFALEDLTPPYVTVSMDLHWSPKLSAESISRVIERMIPPEGKTLTLTLHATAFARVTEEMLATAAAKNITITTP